MALTNSVSTYFGVFDAGGNLRISGPVACDAKSPTLLEVSPLLVRSQASRGSLVILSPPRHLSGALMLLNLSREPRLSKARTSCLARSAKHCAVHMSAVKPSSAAVQAAWYFTCLATKDAENGLLGTPWVDKVRAPGRGPERRRGAGGGPAGSGGAEEGRPGMRTRGSGQGASGSKRAGSTKEPSGGKRGGGSGGHKQCSPESLTLKESSLMPVQDIETEEPGSLKLQANTGLAAAAQGFRVKDVYAQVGRGSLASVYAARQAP